MATQDNNKSVGNDGSWFLEAVGALPPSPTPSEAVAALELDNTLPDIASVPASRSPEIAFSSFDGSTGTSTSTFEPARGAPPSTVESTGELEIRLPPVTSPIADDTSLSSGGQRSPSASSSSQWRRWHSCGFLLPSARM